MSHGDDGDPVGQPTYSRAAAREASMRAERRDRWSRWALVLLGVAALVGIGAVAVLLADGDDPETTTFAAPSTVAPAPPPTVTVSSPTSVPDRGGAPVASAETSTSAGVVTQPVSPEEQIRVTVLEARELLEVLPSGTLDRVPVAFDRADYDGGVDADPDGNCRTIRHEQLAAQSLQEVTVDGSGCVVETGYWIDAWSREEMFSAEAATVEHVVPLSNSHVLGAWQWDAETKRRFATDGVASARAVVSHGTSAAKGNSPPDRWKPRQRSTWCRYGIDWVRTKARWDLPVTDRERTHLRNMIKTCDEPTTLGPNPAVVGQPVLLAAVATPE